MSDTQRGTWIPTPQVIESANVTTLMRQLGVDSYDALLELSIEQPDRYWRTVLRYCGIVWGKDYEAFIDTQAGKPFPKWFVGGELNWVNSVTRWADSAQGATRVAVIAEREDGATERTTYAELADRVRSFSGGLNSCGVKRGDRVGLLMENGIEATTTLLALAWIGAIVVPLFSGFGVDAIVSRLSACGATALIASTGFQRRGKRIGTAKLVEQALERLPSVKTVIWKHQSDMPSCASVNLDWAEVSHADPRTDAELMAPDDPFMVIYTSGTTGKPKGAVHTHGGFPLKIAHDAAVHFDVSEGDVFCWPADMGWIAGSLVMASALLRGATLVCYDGAPDYPDWSRMSRLVERHRVTHFGSAPTLIRGMASNAEAATRGDTSSIRLLITAGEGIDPEHFGWFGQTFGQARAPVINYTGGTEVSGALLSSVIVKPIAPSGFNTISPGVWADVVDLVGNGVTGVIGELAIRAPFVGMTHGFWEDDSRYIESYWSSIPGIWVHGDLAMRREDGTFFLLGRSDDTIKLAGKRLGPAEIEEILLELPTISEAAAIGVDDPAKGQKLVAFVVLLPGTTVDEVALTKEIGVHVDARLGRPFRPAQVHVVRQLPKTRSSKIMRRVIRSVYTGQPTGDLSALDNPSALTEIEAVAAAR
ncbi:AMP-binding protein [Cupriavidus sp. 2SB]|uniref:AMP-binding protein n=1 Tax=Cupriavidus sp. 2SB TaxID=2502199 RepID=UPI0010F7C0F2|nr:AMP-binding protein [Cupriavidus sp. 2SB]